MGTAPTNMHWKNAYGCVAGGAPPTLTSTLKKLFVLVTVPTIGAVIRQP